MIERTRGVIQGSLSFTPFSFFLHCPMSSCLPCLHAYWGRILKNLQHTVKFLCGCFLFPFFFPFFLLFPFPLRFSYCNMYTAPHREKITHPLFFFGIRGDEQLPRYKPSQPDWMLMLLIFCPPLPLSPFFPFVHGSTQFNSL